MLCSSAADLQMGQGPHLQSDGDPAPPGNVLLQRKFQGVYSQVMSAEMKKQVRRNNNYSINLLFTKCHVIARLQDFSR